MFDFSGDGKKPYIYGRWDSLIGLVERIMMEHEAKVMNGGADQK